MKTIKLTAEDRLIEAAEERAKLEQTTLDDQLRLWLADYAGHLDEAKEAMAVISDLQKKLRTGGQRFTRDQMNAR